MRLPAILILSFLLLLTGLFLWYITPKANKPLRVQTVNISTTKASVMTPYVQLNKKIAALTSQQKDRIAKHSETWPKAPLYDTSFNALDPSYKVATISNTMFDPADDYWGLPKDDKGAYELVDAYCTACHSASIVMQQRATPQRWKELLVWMEEKQGMPALPPEDETLILDYIGTHFSTK